MSFEQIIIALLLVIGIIVGVVALVHWRTVQHLTDETGLLMNFSEISRVVSETMEEWASSKQPQYEADVCEYIAAIYAEDFHGFVYDVLIIAWGREDGTLKERIVRSTLDLLEAEWQWA